MVDIGFGRAGCGGIGGICAIIRIYLPYFGFTCHIRFLSAKNPIYLPIAKNRQNSPGPKKDIPHKNKEYKYIKFVKMDTF